MVQVFKADAKKPKGILYETSQFGYLDLAAAYDSGNVAGDYEGVDRNSNGIEDPASIMGRPTDIFEAMRMNDYIASASKGAQDGSAQISPNGPSDSEV